MFRFVGKIAREGVGRIFNFKKMKEEGRNKGHMTVNLQVRYQQLKEKHAAKLSALIFIFLSSSRSFTKVSLWYYISISYSPRVSDAASFPSEI